MAVRVRVAVAAEPKVMADPSVPLVWLGTNAREFMAPDPPGVIIHPYEGVEVMEFLTT